MKTTQKFPKIVDIIYKADGSILGMQIEESAVERRKRKIKKFLDEIKIQHQSLDNTKS